jgi:hypothetical protein
LAWWSRKEAKERRSEPEPAFFDGWEHLLGEVRGQKVPVAAWVYRAVSHAHARAHAHAHDLALALSRGPLNFGSLVLAGDEKLWGTRRASSFCVPVWNQCCNEAEPWF